MNRPQVYTTLPKAPSDERWLGEMDLRFPDKKEDNHHLIGVMAEFFRGLFA